MSAAPANAVAKGLADGFAIAMSLACLVHCLALPLIFALAPAWSRWLGLPEAMHLWLLLAVAPVTLFVLWKASHGLAFGNRLPFTLGSSGLAIMAVSAVFDAQPTEPWTSSAGATLVALAHVLNWRRRSHAHR